MSDRHQPDGTPVRDEDAFDVDAVTADLAAHTVRRADGVACAPLRRMRGTTARVRLRAGGHRVRRSSPCAGSELEGTRPPPPRAGRRGAGGSGRGSNSTASGKRALLEDRSSSRRWQTACRRPRECACVCVALRLRVDVGELTDIASRRYLTGDHWGSLADCGPLTRRATSRVCVCTGHCHWRNKLCIQCLNKAVVQSE